MWLFCIYMGGGRERPGSGHINLPFLQHWLVLHIQSGLDFAAGCNKEFIALCFLSFLTRLCQEKSQSCEPNIYQRCVGVMKWHRHINAPQFCCLCRTPIKLIEVALWRPRPHWFDVQLWFESPRDHNPLSLHCIHMDIHSLAVYLKEMYKDKSKKCLHEKISDCYLKFHVILF